MQNDLRKNRKLSMLVMDCLKGMADLINNAILLLVLVNRIYEVY